MDKHIQLSGKTSKEHFAWAFCSGFRLLYAGIASIVHAFIPSFFPFVSEKIVIELAESAIKFREKRNENQSKYNSP